MNKFKFPFSYIYASAYDKAMRAFRDESQATFAGNSFIFVILGSAFGSALSLLNYYLFDLSKWVRAWWPIGDQHYKNPLSSTAAPALLFCVLPAALITWALYVRGEGFRNVLIEVRREGFRPSTLVALVSMLVFAFSGALSKSHPVTMALTQVVYWVFLSFLLPKVKKGTYLRR